MPSNPIKITDTTFRDAHQSLMATRLRTSDMEPIAGDMDSVGFHSMEVWGGATFDVATRFLAEDPWERLRTFKRLMPNTPLMMLLRGQALVGYRIYADDVVDAFVRRAAEVGIDVFRVFDALNDERNLQRAAEAVKRNGKHLQLAICYSISEGGRLGGPIYNLDYFVERARLLQDMGADSICLKDMGGIMAPYDAYELVAALKAVLDVPLQLHTHYTSGMASMTVLKAIEAGVDVVDACLSPLALRTSQPAVEPLVVTLRNTDRDSGLDLDKLLPLGDHLESVLPAYREQMESPKAAVIDAKVLDHQIPGGMASNLVSQLREADALNRLDAVLREIPKTRKDLGYPPLVTPMSQIVGSQSVSNVLFGRYQMISTQVKDYVYGLYGRAPAPMNPEVVSLVLRDYERGQQPVSGRPADFLEPEMDRAKDDVKELSSDIDDVLIYALYPTTGMRFLRIKCGLEPVPDEMKTRTETLMQQQRISVPGATKSGACIPADTTPLSPRARLYNVRIGEDLYQVEVDPVQGARKRPVGASSGPEDRGPAGDTGLAQSADAAVVAPMPGLVVRYMVEIDQTIEVGDPVVVLEAMKMENTLPAPVSGRVTALTATVGVTVAKDQVLAIIAP